MKRRDDRTRRSFSQKQIFGDWILEEKIGQGGNGQVWRVRHSVLGAAAIKLLSFKDERAFIRFKAEVEALEKLRNVDGIVPLLDRFIPNKFSDEVPWIVMPLAVPIRPNLLPQDNVRIVEYFLQLAVTISEVHLHGMSHRDIKPENLLFLNERIYLSDFGLVKFPGRQAITRERQDVGPKFTMAPEMRRSAYRADGQMADVFSFAKTLWVILSGKALGFDGQYVPSGALALKNFMPNQYTDSIDRLLQECTDDEPARRPTMIEVIRRLEEWITLARDFHSRNLREWAELESKIFPAGLPKQATWTNIDSICSVINTFAGVYSLIHMFYPTRGGNDITGASRAGEAGFIALHVGGRPRDILKPKKLTFESFDRESQWNYFRLEAERVHATGIENAVSPTGQIEWLVEYEDGIYISRDHWEADDYYGEPLPPYARPVVRYLNGSFVFFSKRSYYNRSIYSYDAIHEEAGEDRFREIINALAIGEFPAENEVQGQSV